MIDRKLIETNVKSIKMKIEKQLLKNNWNTVLELVALCARILYSTNIYYMDEELESYLKHISARLIKKVEQYNSEEDCLLFWDGFGINNRGLVQIYLKALCQCKKVLYVTYADREGQIPDILDELNRMEGDYYFIRRGKKADEISQIDELVRRYRPSRFFFYSVPEDVTATCIMYAYEGLFTRYQINLTDQAFWLGAGCLDRCIEFREYGANISVEYRRIDKDKIFYLPYYPVYDENQVFKGYPFPFDESKQKLVFSGGNLYKTLGGKNRYYEVVEYILSKHQDVVFWYAGSGDSRQMEKIIARYPGRAFLSEERKDLFQVMKHSLFYLNTYPIAGGLMMQYAAGAGIVPVTLRYDREGSGILIGQDNLGIEFDDVESLEKEIDRLISDSEYLIEKSGRMKKSIITTIEFKEKIDELLDGQEVGVSLNFKHEDTRVYRDNYLLRISKDEFYGLFARRSYVIFRMFPIKFYKGGVYKIRLKMRKFIKKTACSANIIKTQR